MAPAQAPYLDDVRRILGKAGLEGEFTYRGAVDRDGKLAFLRELCWLHPTYAAIGAGLIEVGTRAQRTATTTTSTSCFGADGCP